MLKATFVELLLYAIHAAFAVGTFWKVMVHDKGRSRLIRCGLVTIMYLIATSPLAVRTIFIQESDDKTQETHIYSPGWILLSSTSFMANILITNSIAMWFCWFLCGRRWMFSVIPGLCIIVGTSFSLYKMIATPASGDACAAQIDWMLPYFSMSLAITLLCTAVILYCIIMGPRIGRRTCWPWIMVIVEELLLLAVVPTVFLVLYITSDTRRGCPLLVVTMIMSLAPILAVAQVPSDTVTVMLWPRHYELRRLGTEGNAGLASDENQDDSAV
ncbi:hypothetical protein ARMSODRAFT_1018282 [Armillaria solidipes]|uniref:Uncharacterized protein n=1 Tax=Armillaria solidipes TaxID=1076256 RepID=A0A2H3BH42_9AGAR|nr:hypothetical protein ARMSODRAFT_1018282 [Armillaria solidipes]